MKNNYPTKKLGEVCVIFNGVSVPKHEMRSRGKYKIIKNRDYDQLRIIWDNDENGWSDRPVPESKLLKIGDSLLINAAHNKSHVASKIGFVTELKYPASVSSGEVMVIRAKQGEILPETVHFLLQSMDLIDRLKEQVDGIHLYPKDVAEIEIPVPPVVEQRKIVARIEKQFAKIDEAARLRAESQTLAKELLPAALHEIFSSAESKGWEEKTLEEVSEITSSKRIYEKEYVDSGIPFYRTKEIGDLEDGRKIKTELFISEERFNEIQNKFGYPQQDDLLLTAIGTIGKIYIVQKNDIFYFKDGNILWLRKLRNIDPIFLRMFLKFTILEMQNMSAGSAYKALPINKLKKIKIPLPPLEEQKKIVKKLDALAEKARDLRELQAVQAADFKALKQSILHEAFLI